MGQKVSGGQGESAAPRDDRALRQRSDPLDRCAASAEDMTPVGSPCGLWQGSTSKSQPRSVQSMPLLFQDDKSF